MVSSETIWSSEADSAPASAAALPPPGVGVPAASLSANSSMVSFASMVGSFPMKPKARAIRPGTWRFSARQRDRMEIYRRWDPASRLDWAQDAVLDHHAPLFDHGPAMVHPEVVDEMAVVRDVEHLEVGRLADFEAPDPRRDSEGVGGVERGGGDRLRRPHPHPEPGDPKN